MFDLDRNENHIPLRRSLQKEEEEEEEEEEDEVNDDGRMENTIIPTIFHDRILLSQLNANLDRRNRQEEEDWSDCHRPNSSGDGGDGGNGGNGGNDHCDDPLLSLFAVDDIPQILSHEEMKHHTDYKLVKKVVLSPTTHHPDDAPGGGEEYNGSTPETQYNLEEILCHFHHGAFSLVINKMQH